MKIGFAETEEGNKIILFPNFKGIDLDTKDKLRWFKDEYGHIIIRWERESRIQFHFLKKNVNWKEEQVLDGNTFKLL